MTIDGQELLSIAYESDLSSASRPSCPAAVDAATAGDCSRSNGCVCLDAVFNASGRATSTSPSSWRRTAATARSRGCPNDPTDARRAALDAAIAALPPGSPGHTGSGRSRPAPPRSASTGRHRPAAPRSAPGPLPNVPVLVLAGDRDIRTPASNATAIAARFPQGKVVVVPGAGHSVLNHSACAADAVRRWLGRGDPAGDLHAVLALRPAARRSGGRRSPRRRPPPRPRAAGPHARRVPADDPRGGGQLAAHARHPGDDHRTGRRRRHTRPGRRDPPRGLQQRRRARPDREQRAEDRPVRRPGRPADRRRTRCSRSAAREPRTARLRLAGNR